MTTMTKLFMCSAVLCTLLACQSSPVTIDHPELKIQATEHMVELDMSASLGLKNGAIRAILAVLGIDLSASLTLVIDLDTGEVCGEGSAIGAPMLFLSPCIEETHEQNPKIQQ